MKIDQRKAEYLKIHRKSLETLTVVVINRRLIRRIRTVSECEIQQQPEMPVELLKIYIHCTATIEIISHFVSVFILIYLDGSTPT